MQSNAVHDKLIEQCTFVQSPQGYDRHPDEQYAEDANFEDENNHPIPINIDAIRQWRQRDCLARIMIYQTNDKERQKGINL